VKVYRIAFTQTTTQHIDIPADRVKAIRSSDGTLHVVAKNGDPLVVIPTRDIVGTYLLDLPEQPARAAEPPVVCDAEAPPEPAEM